LGPVLFFVLLYGAVLPGVLVWMFYSNWREPFKKRFLDRVGAVVAPYRRETFYWEAVILLKRTLFVVSQDFLSQSSYTTRYFVSISILLSFFLVESVLRPYVSTSFNRLAITWSLNGVIVLLCQGVVFQRDIDLVVQSAFGVLLLVFLFGAIFVNGLSLLRVFSKSDYMLVVPHASLMYFSDRILKSVNFVGGLTRAEYDGGIEVMEKQLDRLPPKSKNELLRVMDSIGGIGEVAGSPQSADVNKRVSSGEEDWRVTRAPVFHKVSSRAASINKDPSDVISIDWQKESVGI
jgi:hypothetical protein